MDCRSAKELCTSEGGSTASMRSTHEARMTTSPTACGVTARWQCVTLKSACLAGDLRCSSEGGGSFENFWPRPRRPGTHSIELALGSGRPCVYISVYGEGERISP